MATANPVDRHAGGRHGRCSADLGSFRLSGIGAHERSASSDGRVLDALSGRPKVAIVTGGSSGIGLEMVKKPIEKGYRVVANSRNITSAMTLHNTADLKLVDGDIGLEETAKRVVSAAIQNFETVDLLVNNAGIFIPKPFTEYTAEDFR